MPPYTYDPRRGKNIQLPLSKLRNRLHDEKSPLDELGAVIDHVEAFSTGGANTEENLAKIEIVLVPQKNSQLISAAIWGALLCQELIYSSRSYDPPAKEIEDSSSTSQSAVAIP